MRPTLWLAAVITLSLAASGAWAADAPAAAQAPAEQQPQVTVQAAPPGQSAPAQQPQVTIQGAPPGQPAAAMPPAETLPDIDVGKLSYGFGSQTGMNLKRLKGDIDVDIDMEAFNRGLKDALDGKPSEVNDADMNKIREDFSKYARIKQQEMRKKQGEVNIEEEKTFMAENGKKEGVVTLPSGVQYKVITEGSGRTPAATDRVKVNYKGTFVDGTEFDSSFKRNAPAEFGVSGVIKGWTEALQLMKEGAKWQVVIPAALGYGERGMPGMGGPKNAGIPPNKMLIFEVELVEVLPVIQTAPTETPKSAP